MNDSETVTLRRSDLVLELGVHAIAAGGCAAFARMALERLLEPSFAIANAVLFATLALLYEAAARLRPEWRDRWRERHVGELPPKYDFGNEIAKDAAYDVRYATALLQRYRWKSVVQPLFHEIDEPAWTRFSTTASDISPALLAIIDRHEGLLREDEVDWINVAFAPRAATAIVTKSVAAVS